MPAGGQCQRIPADESSAHPPYLCMTEKESSAARKELSMPSNETSSAPHRAIDLNDEKSIAEWCEHFGITAAQLKEAVRAVGSDSAALREHLLNQGASAGAG